MPRRDTAIVLGVQCWSIGGDAEGARKCGQSDDGGSWGCVCRRHSYCRARLEPRCLGSSEEAPCLVRGRAVEARRSQRSKGSSVVCWLELEIVAARALDLTVSEPGRCEGPGPRTQGPDERRGGGTERSRLVGRSRERCTDSTQRRLPSTSGYCLASSQYRHLLGTSLPGSGDLAGTSASEVPCCLRPKPSLQRAPPSTLRSSAPWLGGGGLYLVTCASGHRTESGCLNACGEDFTPTAALLHFCAGPNCSVTNFKYWGRTRSVVLPFPIPRATGSTAPSSKPRRRAPRTQQHSTTSLSTPRYGYAAAHAQPAPDAAPDSMER